MSPKVNEIHTETQMKGLTKFAKSKVGGCLKQFKYNNKRKSVQIGSNIKETNKNSLKAKR